MRAFLRPASSPWIVFDRDSRVDDFATSALRLGKVFASSPSFIEDSSGDVVSSVPLDRPITEPPPKAQTRSDAPPLPPPTIDPGVAAAPPAVAPKPDAFANGAVLGHAMSSVLPSTGVFPPSTGAPDAVVEPSNLVVATDVISADSSSELSASGEVSLVAPRGASRRAFAFVAGACACVLALAGAAVLVAGGRAETKAAAAAQAAPTVEAVQAAAAPIVDPPAPTLELDQVEPPAPASDEAAPSKPEKKNQFGKLTIKNEAKYKNVYFDGKRMLGTGQRTFLVYCGKHTIAVNDKADAKEVEIPCSGEYVVSK